MRLRLTPFVFLFVLLTARPAATQQTLATAAQRDPQAIAVITKALNAAGGLSVLAVIQDFTSSGTIIYNWADSQVQGSVNIKGRGLAQFRLDATLPVGVRSFITNNGTGLIKEVDGTTTPIPYYQAVSFGSSVFFPLAQLLAASQNASVNVTYQGLVTRAGSQVHDIRIQGLVVPALATGGIPANLALQDFFIDSSTFQITGTLGKAYAKDGSSDASPAEIQYSDYRQVGGLLVPFSMTNLIGNQTTFVIQLDHVTFNNNLTDSDFQ